MISLKKLGLLTLVAAVTTGSTACSSGAIFGVTSWETLDAGQVAAFRRG